MFDNLKELLAVVQDGLTSSNNIRHTLSEVQRVKFGFQERSQPRVELGAGAELLDYYQKQWAEIHESSEDCASAAEHVDKFVTDIHEKTKLRLIHTSDLLQSLTSLPRLSAAVDECVEQLGSLQQLLLTVETELMELEDLVDRHEIDQRKVDHHYHLSLYKEKKLAALETQRVELAAEASARHAERERSRLQALQGRSRAAADAFTEDMRRYLAAGVAPSKSPPPAEGLTLEQVELDDTDQSALDHFLDS